MKSKNKPIDRTSSYIIIIPTVIIFFIVLERIYPYLASSATRLGFPSLQFAYPNFLSQDGYYFVLNFIDWFSILYGLFLPILLIKTWQQFGDIDRKFQLENIALKTLAESILLLGTSFRDFKLSLLTNLLQYSEHVRDSYSEECFDEQLKFSGGQILSDVRKHFYAFSPSPSTIRSSEFKLELLLLVNNLVILREERIIASGQRVFESLRTITLVLSLLWLTPLYFVNFSNESDLFSQLLVLGATFLIVYVFTIMDDLDEPFHGAWKIRAESWSHLSGEISSMLMNLKDEKPITRKKKNYQ